MLVLTRRFGEKICISDEKGTIAEVMILEVRGNQVRIGVTADTSIAIDREEIYQRKLDEKAKALGAK